MAKALNTRQLAYVAGIKAGMNGTQAAIAAGYPASSAKFASRRLLANALVKAEVDRIHDELRERTQYDLQAAVAEVDRVLVLAQQRGNVMAMAKLLEQKQKMHGLHINKVELDVKSTVDINTALADARNRVSLRPMRDLPITIEGDSVGAQAPQLAGPIDTQSTAPSEVAVRPPRGPVAEGIYRDARRWAVENELSPRIEGIDP